MSMKNLGRGASCRGAFGRGVIETVATAGSVMPSEGAAVEASPQAPVARVRVYAPRDDGYLPTARSVAALLAQLVPVIELRAPSRPPSETAEACRNAAIAARQARAKTPLGAAPENHPARTAPLTIRYCDPDAAGFLGLIEPDDRTWAAFIGKDGFSLVYGRGADGKPQGAPTCFNREVQALEPLRGFDRDLGPDAVHVDGGMKKMVRHGVEYVIDRPKGSVRVGYDENGARFETTMTCDYGYVIGTRGGDGKPIDHYVGEAEDAKEVHVINQVRSDGSADEQKVMVGHRSQLDACRVYYDHTPSRYFGGCFSLSIREYKRQLRAAKKTPNQAFTFTHAMSPDTGDGDGDDDEEPTSSQRGRALVTGGTPPGTPPPAPVTPAPQPRVVQPTAADMARLEAGTFEVTLSEALFLREGRAASGGIRVDSREVDCVMSNEEVDSYGTILRSGRWDLRRFVGDKANPVLLWVHNRRMDLPPVGTVKNVRQDPVQRALCGTACFDDSSPFDDIVWNKYKNGTMRGFSVGFDPREARVEVIGGEEILVFDNIELQELSCAPVPSNAGALAVEARQRAMKLVRDAPHKRVAAEGGFRAMLEDALKVRVPVSGQIRTEPAPPGTTPQIAPSSGDQHRDPEDGDALDEEAYAADPSRGAVPYTKTPIVDIAWDAGEARKALEKWASSDGSGDGDKIDRAKFAKGFAYEDKADKTLGAFKLPHHTVRDGKLVCVRNALSAAVGAINGSHGTKVQIPDADLPRVKKHLARHYADAGLPSPWEKDEKRAPKPVESSAMTLVRIEKNAIRAVGDGAVACTIACTHCKGELELVRADLPEDVAHARALSVLTQEKGAAEARALKLEETTRILGTDLVRYMFDVATRDVDSLIGTKLDPSEREAELDMARTLIEGYQKRVPFQVDATTKVRTPYADPTRAPQDAPMEYEGMLRWEQRVLKLRARNDLGMLGRSVIPRDPTRPNVDPSRIGTQPPGGPAIPGQTGPDPQGRSITHAGASLASLVVAEAGKPEPQPLIPQR